MLLFWLVMVVVLLCSVGVAVGYRGCYRFLQVVAAAVTAVAVAVAFVAVLSLRSHLVFLFLLLLLHSGIVAAVAARA